MYTTHGSAKSQAGSTPQGASSDHGSKDGGDLTGALEDAAAALRSAGVVLKVTGEDPAQIPVPTAELFAWAVREGTTNILRHAGAASCTVRLTRTQLTMENDADHPLNDQPFGNGLRGLSARAAEQGAALEAGPITPQTYRLTVTASAREGKTA